MMTIIIAVVIILLLVAVVCYAYLKLRCKPGEDDNTFELLCQTRCVKNKWL